MTLIWTLNNDNYIKDFALIRKSILAGRSGDESDDQWSKDARCVQIDSLIIKSIHRGSEASLRFDILIIILHHHLMGFLCR